MTKRSTILFLFAMLFSFSVAVGQEAQKPVTVKALVEGGVEFGGDDVLTVFFTNGEDQTIRAGQGGYLAAGAEFTFSIPLMIRTTVGWKYMTTAAQDANIRFVRVPFQVMGFYTFADGFRAGVGGVTNFSVNLKGDGFVPDTEFTSNFGPKFEFGYKWIAVNYTILEFEDPSGFQYSANSFGIALSFAFPNK